LNQGKNKDKRKRHRVSTQHNQGKVIFVANTDDNTDQA
jgi:hypothetical protein